MTTLVLHIGTEKTGTTTIQHFLAENRAALKERGILIPWSLGATNHRKLPAMANEDDYIDDFFRYQALLDQEDRRRAKEDWRRSFISEVTTKKPRLTVASSEHLQSRLRKNSEVERLFGIVSPYFDQIKVLVYIRDPLETIVSLHSTAIKYGSVLADPPKPSDPYFSNVVNHRATVERWGAVFGFENLIVRRFNNDDFPNGDLILDFIAASGLPDIDYRRPLPQNMSLSRVGLELLRRINRQVPIFLPDDTVNPMRGDIAGYFESYLGQGERYSPGPDLVRAWREALSESDEWIRQRYFPDSKELFPRAAPLAEPKADVYGDDLDRLAALLSDLWQRRKVG